MECDDVGARIDLVQIGRRILLFQALPANPRISVFGPAVRLVGGKCTPCNCLPSSVWI
jgi:hypothetical protein